MLFRQIALTLVLSLHEFQNILNTQYFGKLIIFYSYHSLSSPKWKVVFLFFMCPFTDSLVTFCQQFMLLQLCLSMVRLLTGPLHVDTVS